MYKTCRTQIEEIALREARAYCRERRSICPKSLFRLLFLSIFLIAHTVFCLHSTSNFLRLVANHPSLKSQAAPKEYILMKYGIENKYLAVRKTHRALSNAIGDVEEILESSNRTDVDDETTFSGHHKTCSKRTTIVMISESNIVHIVPKFRVDLPECLAEVIKYSLKDLTFHSSIHIFIQ